MNMPPNDKSWKISYKLIMEKFYVSCPLGQEKTVWQEIKLKLADFVCAEPNFTPGGIELEMPLAEGLVLNHKLKTSNRILLRLKAQKCKDAPKLFNIIAKFPWKNYLKRPEVKWHITAKESRLFNSSKIEKACQDGLTKYFNANQLPAKLLERKDEFHIQNIFIRLEKDDLTLSIDTTGDLAHIRGNDSFRGHASLRSTLASIMIMHTLLDESQPVHIFDPMCGTGTLLKEIRDFYKVNIREFAYQDWHAPLSVEDPDQKLPYLSLWGQDLDQAVIKHQGDEAGILFTQGDAFEPPLHTPSTPLMIICNPPYGKRIKIHEDRKDFYRRLLEKLTFHYRPKLIALLIPEEVELSVKSKKIRIFNGGIWCQLHLINLSN
jgi:putative N6-adenine-specific DNA methylase